MYGCNYTKLELWLHDQTQIIANAACRVCSQQILSYFLTFYCDPCFLLKFLFTSNVFTCASKVTIHRLKKIKAANVPIEEMLMI